MKFGCKHINTPNYKTKLCISCNKLICNKCTHFTPSCEFYNWEYCSKCAADQFCSGCGKVLEISRTSCDQCQKIFCDMCNKQNIFCPWCNQITCQYCKHDCSKFYDLSSTPEEVVDLIEDSF